MNPELIDREHPAYGKIAINTFNGGTDHLFGQRKTNSGAISIDFNDARLSDSFGDITRLYPERTLFRINFTSEQWSELILNKNSENGIPVTICFDEQGSVEWKKDMYSEDAVFEQYAQDIKDKFKNVFLSEKEAIDIFSKDKISAADRKQLLEIFENASNTLLKDKKFLENKLDSYLNEVENFSEEKFIKGIQKNILDAEYTKLIEGPTVTTIENRHQGVLVLKTVTGAQGTFIKDYEANNGVSLTLYRAVVKKEGKKETIVKTDEKLIEVKMSNSQFSQFIISFGKSHLPCTISNRLGTEIEPCPMNINDEAEAVYKLYKHIDSMEEKVESFKEEITELLSKTPSKERNKKSLFVFEKLSRLVGVDFKHYAKEVFDSGLKYSIRRQEDVQSGIIENINKKGMEEFRKNPTQLKGIDQILIENNKSK